MSDDTKPIAYFITFTCYGTWLHGDRHQSVDKENNTYNSPYIKKNADRAKQVKKQMQHNPYSLDSKKRKIALDSIINTCIFLNWDLYAAHIRTNHIHLIVSPEHNPEIMLVKFKRYISRALNKIEIENMKRWTRHGSTRYLWRTRELVSAIQYVITGQGKMMEHYVDPRYSMEAGDILW